MCNSACSVCHDSIPHLIHIEFTYACNQNCLPCYNPNRGCLGSIEHMYDLVNKVAQARIPHVYIIGGEPSLIPVKHLNNWIELLSEHSSVTIVTNGVITLKNISQKLACFGVPIHGKDAETHDRFTQNPGGFKKTIETIKYYVAQGFDVRCIPVLVNFNHDQMYEIIKLAAELGMESVFVDRYEDGGLGAERSKIHDLKPTNEQFRIGVGQVIQARHDFKQFNGKIGFGTAIPYCLDPRIVVEGITSDCGVGSSFSAINPDGAFRICNQSEIVYGNIFEEPIVDIWNKIALNDFRDLSWVTEPCKSCPLLMDCLCGCKVDVNQSNGYSIDYAVRNGEFPNQELVNMVKHLDPVIEYPSEMRKFSINRYTKLTTMYPTKYLVARYQTVVISEDTVPLVQWLLRRKSEISEQLFINSHSEDYDPEDLRIFISQLIQVEALDLL